MITTAGKTVYILKEVVAVLVSDEDIGSHIESVSCPQKTKLRKNSTVLVLEEVVPHWRMARAAEAPLGAHQAGRQWWPWLR